MKSARGGKPILASEEIDTSAPGGFEDAYRRHYPAVLRRLAYLLGDRAAAEELAQETFLKLYSAPPPAPANLAGWLYRVAGRLALNRLRDEERRRRRETAAALSAPDVLPLEEQVLRREEVLQVRRALTALAPRDRLVLLLREEGASYEEIALTLRVRRQVVGSLLARARRRFLAAYRTERGGKA